MTGFTALADALPTLRELTPDDAADVEDVLDAAKEWSAGRLPFDVAATTGNAVAPSGFASPAWTRYLAVRATPHTDPRRPALMRLIDACIGHRGKVVTDFGIFESAELRASDEQVRAANVMGRTDR